MEPASVLISRPVPQLKKINGATHPEVSGETISARFLHEWANFEAEVIAACASLDLNVHVPITDDRDEGEHFAVGNELGLTGRFTKHVCDAVSKVLSVTSLSAFTFGDYLATDQLDMDKAADVTMINLPVSRAFNVVGLKSFWSVRLEDYPVNMGPNSLIPMQPYFGQVVGYMLRQNLKYAALSTYCTTVFIRRTGDYLFELSLPIDQKATRPSLRECFLALCVFSSQDPNYFASFDFCAESLGIPTQPLVQASTRPTPRGHLVATGDTEGMMIGSHTILFGGRDGSAHSWVNCGTLVQRSRHKAVYEVMWDGQPAIAKCYSELRYESYVHEANTYERIYQRRPQGFEFFANLLAHGKIACSSLFPTGYILIITKVPGHPLIEQWSNLYTHEKAYVYFQVKKAIDILRSISMISVDSGMHNILYSPMSERVTMHDFEIMQGCDQNTINTDMPELFAIFGQMAVEESHRDFFGN